MNKKLIGNLFLVALVIALGLSFIDLGKTVKSHEDIISCFVNDNLEKETAYKPIVFKRIDEPFLMQNTDISVAYATVVDSIDRQLELLADQYLSLDFQNCLQKANTQAQSLRLETVYHFLPLHAEMKRELKKYVLDEELKATLYGEETQMYEGINSLNTALGKYNLSIFSLQLNEDSNPIYWHQYELKNEEGSSVFEAVFELEKEKREILSFNII